MVTIKDGCGCGTASCCSWKEKLEEAYKRATASVNKIGDDAGSVYFPDGTGYVKLPLPTGAQVAQIQTNADDIATLKQRATASEGDIDTLEQDVVRIDAKDATQDTSIKDNSDRITSTNNDLIATEATVATHDSDIITLKANNEALAKSLVSDVLMTDGTTAGSVQVSIERKDGTLITSANYRWGKDIGIRLEAGTQAGYVKAVISLSDGTELVSNEYKIVEVLESDVYVTAITLVPDMTAGTIGGNISYSNGTTQTINSVNVPTAPGVTSSIEALQSRMTAVEQKNTTQDADITSLKSRVQAIEDTPGVGQFAAGKLGTIAGSAADGRVKAEDDGTGSVNGWSALKSRVTAAEGQIATAQNGISALDGTVAQQTAEISGLKTDVTNIQNKDVEQDARIDAISSNIIKRQTRYKSIEPFSITLNRTFTLTDSSPNYIRKISVTSDTGSLFLDRTNSSLVRVDNMIYSFSDIAMMEHRYLIISSQYNPEMLNIFQDILNPIFAGKTINDTSGPFCFSDTDNTVAFELSFNLTDKVINSVRSVVIHSVSATVNISTITLSNNVSNTVPSPPIVYSSNTLITIPSTYTEICNW